MYTITVYYKGVRQFYHTQYHCTKIKIVNKLRTIPRKLEVFLGEENMLRYIDLRVSLYPSWEKTYPKKITSSHDDAHLSDHAVID